VALAVGHLAGEQRDDAVFLEPKAAQVEVWRPCEEQMVLTLRSRCVVTITLSHVPSGFLSGRLARAGVRH